MSEGTEPHRDWRPCVFAPRPCTTLTRAADDADGRRDPGRLPRYASTLHPRQNFLRGLKVFVQDTHRGGAIAAAQRGQKRGVLSVDQN
jgi:hypothetical protein